MHNRLPPGRKLSVYRKFLNGEGCLLKTPDMSLYSKGKLKNIHRISDEFILDISKSCSLVLQFTCLGVQGSTLPKFNIVSYRSGQ